MAEESSTFQLGKEDGSIAPTTIANRIGAVSPIQIRDRIKELRRVRASELLPIPKIGGGTPQAQVAAFRGCSTKSATSIRCLPENYPTVV